MRSRIELLGSEKRGLWKPGWVTSDNLERRESRERKLSRAEEVEES